MISKLPVFRNDTLKWENFHIRTDFVNRFVGIDTFNDAYFH